MSWISAYVRPKLRALVGKADLPDNLWQKCPGCGGMLFHRDLERQLHVCQYCGYHLRVSAKQRLAMLFDDGVWTSLPTPKVPVDPLKFRDSKRYGDRLKDAQTKTGETDALLVGVGALGGRSCVIAAFDFNFMGGSMGIAVGEAFVAAARAAIEQHAPLIAIPASGGARMQEGILSLMQMPRTVIAVEMVKEAGLPYIVLLTDPTTGGVTASFAMLGDVALAEPGAVIGFAGQRVIEETIREQLPEGFQRAEYLLDHGMVDIVVGRDALRETLIRLIGLLRDAPPGAPDSEPRLALPASLSLPGPAAEATAAP